MSLVVAQSLVEAQTQWAFKVDLSPFAPRKQSGNKKWSLTTLATCTHLFHSSPTIAAAADTTLDLRAAFTALSGESVTASKICGLWVRVTGDGGILRMEPGASNPLTWPFSASGYRLLTPGINGACWGRMNGSVVTVSNSVRNWKLSNTGTAEIEVTLVAFVGT